MSQKFATVLLLFMAAVAIGLIWFNIAALVTLKEEVHELEDLNTILIEENVHLKDYLEKNT